MDWWVGFLGHSDGPSTGQTYVFGRTSNCVFFFCYLVHYVPCEVSLHQQTPRGFAVCVTTSPNSIALWDGFFWCLCEHHPNSCESLIAVHLGSTSEVCISIQQRDKLLHRELTSRFSIRPHAKYMTICFGAKGYIPGESLMDSVGSVVKSGLESQRAATSQSCVARSQRRE